MKTKHLLLFLLVTVFSTGFMSCSKDDDQPNEEVKENEIVYGAIKTKFIGAFCLKQVSSNSGTSFNLFLYSDGINIPNVTSEQDFAPQGTGQILNIALYAVDGYLDGDYIFNEVVVGRSTYTKGIIPHDKSFLMNTLFDYSSEEGSELKVLGTFMNNQTTISIKKIGSEFELVMQGKDNAGNSVSTYYKGAVTFNTID